MSLSSDYHPFGMLIPDRNGAVSGTDYRYGFQAQECDQEMSNSASHYAFEYRIHDARIGRFLSIDPLTGNYPYNSPYSFCENTPIAFVELEGLEKFYAADGSFIGQFGTSNEMRFVNYGFETQFKQEFSEYNSNPEGYSNTESGQNMIIMSQQFSHPVFKSTDETAIYWGAHNNSMSINNNVEYGTVIYEVEIDGEIYFNYGTTATSNESSQNRGYSITPKDVKVVADIHTHSAYMPSSFFYTAYNNEFSDADTKSNNENKTDGYVATPGGYLLKYDYKTGKISEVNHEMPYDKNDPSNPETQELFRKWIDGKKEEVTK